MQVGIDQRPCMRKPTQFVDCRQTLPWDYFPLARDSETDR